MFAQDTRAPATQNMPQADQKRVHLMLVRTPKLTPRGLAWLERSRAGEFNGRTLQRLIQMEKLSLG